jgi:hypothetical protein
MADEEVDTVLAGFTPISLEALDDRAALLHRVDFKYVLSPGELLELLRRFAGDHDALEIDGRRRFSYGTVYFDTPDLRTFHDHVAGRRPRFKLRTRCYLDNHRCQFEVKVKTTDDQTDKRQTDHRPGAEDEISPAARRLIDEALSDAGAEPINDLRPVLATGFHRFTLAARGGGMRATCDLDLRLTRVDDGSQARLRDARVVLETKSEEGDSAIDQALRDVGVDAVSMSKYRVGIDLLVEPDTSGETAPLRRLFKRVPADA